MRFRKTSKPFRLALSSLLLLLACRASGAWGQSAGDTVYAVHGRVVDAVSGAPLSRALVSSADRRLATMTDGEGRFSIKLSVPERSAAPSQSGVFAAGGVVASSLLLLAQKPGYLAGTSPLAVPLDDALNTTELQLKLMPTAGINGSVTAEGTAAPANVPVQLLRLQAMDGSRFWQPAGHTQTDSRGEFRFSGLHSGEYAVMTTTWQGDDPPSRERPDLTEHTEQYPPMFYGGTVDLAGSTKLLLHAGESARAQIRLREARFYRVVLPVAAEVNRPMGINARFAGSQNFNGYTLSYNQRDGAVEGALPDGTYDVRLAGFGKNPGFASVVVHVAGKPVTSSPVALTLPESVAIHIQWDLSGSVSGGQEQANPSFFVSLQPEDRSPGGASGSSPPGQADLTLEAVPPGTYTVQATPSTGYVAAASWGGVDLLRQPLVVGSSGTSAPIYLTVRNDVSELSGRVTGGEALPARGGLVVLLPMEGIGRMSRSVMQPDGTYRLQGVPPGSYLLLAGTGEPSQLAYKEQETRRSLEGKGRVLLIQSGGQQTADAPWVGDFSELVP